MPMLYFAHAVERVGVYYTSLSGVGDPAYKPPPMPTPRKLAAAAPISDTQAVVAGGITFSSGVLGAENRLFMWTAWASRAAMPAARQAHRAVRLPDGRIAFLGGQTSQTYGSESNSVFIYNPATDSWSSGPSMPQAKAYMACALLEGVGGGLIWVAAGSTPTSIVSATTHLLDLSTMTWSAAASLPKAIGEAAGGALPGGRAGLPGGFGNSDTQQNTALNTFYIYDPVSNTWSVGPAMPTARSAHAVQWADRELVVIGGWPAGASPRANEAYNPFANVWRANPSAPVDVMDVAWAKVGKLVFTWSNNTSADLVMAYWP